LILGSLFLELADEIDKILYHTENKKIFKSLQ